ncbi:MAG: Gfo/Idh/MocA family oxidoreductase [Gammaproteobacteria bacterium]|nr:Gfo/Idh/MocA family oxidoreductase [Gammaproteobacteria bacterium]
MIIVGAGNMGLEYAKVLTAQKIKFGIICRDHNKENYIRTTYGYEISSGGLSNYILANSVNIPSSAIVCVPVDQLFDVTKELLVWGVKNVLIEKPGSLYKHELEQLARLAHDTGSDVRIGYNRRFYASVLELKKILKQEKLVAVNFEISEWEHVVAIDPSSDITKQRWFLANTSHVVDLVFHLAGLPESINCYSSGCLDWHNSASRFTGAGRFSGNVLFSYSGYWDCPGRWSVEFLTNSKKYIFRPLEKLQIQEKASVAISEVLGIDYSLDIDFKPGLYMQTKSFVSRQFEELCSLSEQIECFSYYERIANYSNK